MAKSEKKMIQLEVKAYHAGKKSQAKRCRSEKQIPAVIYGPKIAENVHVMVDYVRFEKMFPSIQRNIPIELVLDKMKYQVIVKEYQIHPLSRTFIHIDFYCIDPGHAYSTMIPIDYQGIPVGVREGGSLFAYIKTISVKGTVEALPTNIPIDISNIQRKRNVTIRNIEAPKHCQILTDKGTVLAEVK